jgi:hypothetical protein
MGRRKFNEEEKKVKRSVSISPEILISLSNDCINVSSLVNKLLKEYIENGGKCKNNKNLF